MNLAEALDLPTEPTTETPAALPEPVEDDFSDEREWTPERLKSASEQVKKARAEAESLRKQHQHLHQQREARMKKFIAERDAILQEKQAITQMQSWLNTMSRNLQSSDPKLALEALAQIAGRDQYELLDHWNKSLHRSVVEHEETGGLRRQLAELQTELSAIKQHREQETRAQQEHRIDREQRQIFENYVTELADKFPRVAYAAKEAPDEAWEDIKNIRKELGNNVDNLQLFRMLETALEKAGISAPTVATAQSSAVTSGSKSTSKPLNLTPNVSAETSGKPRPLSWEEGGREALLASMPDDADAFLSLLSRGK